MAHQLIPENPPQSPFFKGGSFNNFFQLLNMPLIFTLDLADLAQHYRELQRQIHPDRFVRAELSEQQRSIELSTQVNEAYKTLKDPLLRAIYLMDCLGAPIQLTGKSLSAEFLMKQMQWREQVENWTALNTQQQQQLKNNFQQDYQYYLDQLTDGFIQQPLPTPQIEQWVNELQFVQKLRLTLPD